LLFGGADESELGMARRASMTLRRPVAKSIERRRENL
jgi:hypothetical protein